MSVPTLQEFANLKGRVASLEAVVDALVAQLDDNAKNNAGALTDSYAALGATGNDQYTVTNQTNSLVKFTDGAGTEHVLGAAGGANEAATAVGMSPGITQLVTDGVVTAVAV